MAGLWAFVGGGSNIAIALALPPALFLYCIVCTFTRFMGLNYLTFYECMRLGFRMGRPTQAYGTLFLLFAEYFVVMWGGLS